MNRTGPWAPPKVPHPDVDMRREQWRAIHQGRPLPYPGLPRDWVETAIDVALMYEPATIYHFGSTWTGQDTVGSDIDLLVAFDDLPVGEWKWWGGAIQATARFYCPYPVNTPVTDTEDLVRRRHIVTSPVMWAQREGRLVYDRGVRL